MRACARASLCVAAIDRNRLQEVSHSQSQQALGRMSRGAMDPPPPMPPPKLSKAILPGPMGPPPMKPKPSPDVVAPTPELPLATSPATGM